jgi:hypothetical protein
MIRTRSGVLAVGLFLLLCGGVSGGANTANKNPRLVSTPATLSGTDQESSEASPALRVLRGPERALLGVGQCPGDFELELWPPNHKYVEIDLEQLLGPGVLSIEILGITQDEPVDELGDGHTVCDGNGVGTSVARIRSERSGHENGRVYEIEYSAFGGGCTGFVRISVPHDQSGRPAEDDGQNFDSTEGCP